MPQTGGLVGTGTTSADRPARPRGRSPRTLYYMAKVEAHRVPGLGEPMRAFGAFSVRRGESDRDAVRTMRQIVRDGHAFGLFVEGTRQRSGVPGPVQPGAAMAATNEGVPVDSWPVLQGSDSWRLGNFHPVSLAWGSPLDFGAAARWQGLQRSLVEIEREIRRPLGVARRDPRARTAARRDSAGERSPTLATGLACAPSF